MRHIRLGGPGPKLFSRYPASRTRTRTLMGICFLVMIEALNCNGLDFKPCPVGLGIVLS